MSSELGELKGLWPPGGEETQVGPCGSLWLRPGSLQQELEGLLFPGAPHTV